MDSFEQNVAKLEADRAAARLAFGEPSAPLAPLAPNRKRKNPPATVRPNYFCKRCHEVGRHWESDCPTSDDPAYDYVMASVPRGIPVVKLQRSSRGQLFMKSSGEACELVPNHAAFREILDMMRGNVQQQQEEKKSLAATAHLALHQNVDGRLCGGHPVL